MSDLACPRCPLCGHEPDDAGLIMAMISGGTQVVCSNEECEVFVWDGTQLDGGLSDAAVMEETTAPDGHAVSRPRDATPEEVRQAQERSQRD